MIVLPAPEFDGAPLGELLRDRRSVREFADGPVGLSDVARILWAGQGVTHEEGLRTAPSCGALYPLELYLVAGDVEGVEPGIYGYQPQRHVLEPMREGDHRRDLASAALHQRWIENAPAIIAVAAVPDRTARKYGARAQRYVNIEAGHAAQSVCLQAVSLGLGAAVVAAFTDDRVKQVLDLGDEEVPILLVTVGRPAGS